MSLQIVAILAAYNEERFIASCLEHYAQQGVQVYLIDNGSTDNTRQIAERYLGQNLIGIEDLPRDGVFALGRHLERKEELASTLAADWFIHADVDELRLSPHPNLTLAQAFEKVDREGYNAVNFMEFTFIPVREAPEHDHPDFQKTMRWYYPFLPSFPYHVKAWKRQPQKVDLSAWAGHRVGFPNLKLYPESFPMRHYQFLSVEHANRKYGQRRHPSEDLQKGWQGWREQLSLDIQLPSKTDLREYTTDSNLDSSQPWVRHFLDLALEKSKARSQTNSERTHSNQEENARTIAALRLQIRLLNERLNSLTEQLKAQEQQINSLRILESVAAREVETLHRARLYRLSKAYWQWRDRLRRALWPFGKRPAK